MEEAHRYGKLEWFFYIVVLPLLFTALLSGIILEFLGVDVTGKVVNAAKHVPGVSKLLPQDEQAVQPDAATVQSQLEQQKQEAEDKAAALADAKEQLEDDLVKKNAEIDKLKQQIEADKKQEEDEEAVPPPYPVKELAKVYSQMSPSKAAAIMTNLSVTEAKEIFSKMTSAQRAAILEKMEPVIASKILSS